MCAYETFRYGAFPGQEADLYLPARPTPPVVCLLHGGFWRMPYARDQLSAVAEDLQHRGYAVWNLEYRRIGQEGAGWPGTLLDVVAGIDYLANLQDGSLDLERVVLCGHSAGGQLALWAARQRRSTERPAVGVHAVVGQAPIPDLVQAHALGVGDGAVAELLGGTPESTPDRFADASPHALLPLGVRQLIIHGEKDDVIPLGTVRGYVQAAQQAGDSVELREVGGQGHMEFVDPTSEAHQILCDWLLDGIGA